MTTDPSYDLEDLVRRAFQTARERGKPDWTRMTAAVLKNRLLQLSGRAFSEANHGGVSFNELLAGLSHVVKLNDGVVELVGAAPGEQPAGTPRRAKIRSDLWNAVVDFSSGTRYAWNPSSHQAEEARDGDLLILPTLSRDDFHSWRREFVAKEGTTALLEEWCEEGRPTRFLPVPIQHRWNDFVRSKVKERLEQWFASKHLDPPGGLLQQPQSAEENLRQIVMACIAVMTTAELAAIHIPSPVILRARMLRRP